MASAGLEFAGVRGQSWALAALLLCCNSHTSCGADVAQRVVEVRHVYFRDVGLTKLASSGLASPKCLLVLAWHRDGMEAHDGSDGDKGQADPTWWCDPFCRVGVHLQQERCHRVIAGDGRVFGDSSECSRCGFIEYERVHHPELDPDQHEENAEQEVAIAIHFHDSLKSHCFLPSGSVARRNTAASKASQDMSSTCVKRKLQKFHWTLHREERVDWGDAT